MRAWSAAVASFLFLCGCLSHPAATPQAPEPTSEGRLAVPAFVQPAGTTDTLHLLDAPHATAAAPTGPERATAVPSLADAVVGAGLANSSSVGAVWHFPRGSLRFVAGNATLWVDVEGQVVHDARSCFWAITLRADSKADGGFAGSGSNCVPEDTVVATGVRPLVLHFSGVDASDVVGDTITLSVASTGVYAPGASVRVLGGTAEHDSRVAIRGLAVPLDTTTLLA
jgi:hypothetical protein